MKKATEKRGRKHKLLKTNTRNPSPYMQGGLFIHYDRTLVHCRGRGFL